MDATSNRVNWFEIPVTDLHRAKHFYQVVFSIHMNEAEIDGMRLAIFPNEKDSDKVSGALVQSEIHKPAADGTIVYLNANPDMTPVLERIEQEGGKILTPKTEIGEGMGFKALFTDTEGNRIALHSLQ